MACLLLGLSAAQAQAQAKPLSTDLNLQALPASSPDSLPGQDSLRSLSQTVVTGFHSPKPLHALPAAVNVTPAYLLRQFPGVNISQALAAQSGVAAGGDGPWAQHIQVRGLGESRLVTLIDGCRIATATDLTASLSMVEAWDISRIEVIKGALSTLYGTGAMGGVVNVITQDGYFAPEKYFHSRFAASWAGANRYRSGHVALAGGSRNWYFRATSSVGKATDMHTPKGLLENSGFATYNLHLKTGFRLAPNQVLKAQFQYNAGEEVGIPGGSTFPKTATATYTDIYRTLANVDYEVKDLSNKFKSLSFSGFYHFIQRDVSMVPHTVTRTQLPNGNIQQQTPTEVCPLGTHKTWGFKTRGLWQFSPQHELIAGADLWGRDIFSVRTKYVTAEVLTPDEKVLKTNQVERHETPLPAARSLNAGLFVQDELRLGKRLTLSSGLRVDGAATRNQEVYTVDYTLVNGEREDNPAGKTLTFAAGHGRTFSWSAHAGALYKLLPSLDLTANVARSYRAPSLEELFKYIDLGSTVQLGNPDLKAEHGYHADLGLRVYRSRWGLDLSGYVHRLNNMIVGAFAQNQASGAATLVNKNLGKALLYGLELTAHWAATPQWVFFATGSYVRGQDLLDKQDLPAMAPASGRLGSRYTWAPVGTFTLQAVGAADQDRTAPGEVATAGWLRYDLSLSTRRFPLGHTPGRFYGMMGVENLTNRAYSNHLSTNRGLVDIEPGRNFFVRCILEL